MNELHVLDFPFSTGRKMLASIPTSSPPTQVQYTSYPDKGTFGSDLVMILPIFLCFFIIGPGLRYLFRCLLGSREQTMVDSSDRVADTGLLKPVFIALPIIVYTATSGVSPASTDCTICLSEFAEGEKMRVLPECNHGFHVECIDNWLVSHSSCPMCRHRLKLPSGDEKPGGSAMVQSSESTNRMNMVTESTNSSRAGGVDSRHIETFRRTPDEAAVMATSRLPASRTLSECSECCIYKFG